MATLSRSAFLAAGAAATAAVALPSLPAAADPARTLRIAYQRNGVLLIVKQQGLLEKRLAPLGVSVSWSQFETGPPILEALNGNGLDIGLTGDSPPIFAQVGNASFVYLAAVPDPGENCGIVVHADSGITSLAGLKGKRIAFSRGSIAHNLVARALASARLTFAQVQAVNLQPADAAAAYRNGSVDAYAVWDPFFALAQQMPNTRTLITADKVAPSNRFFLAAKSFAAQNPQIVSAFVDEVAAASRWAGAHRNDIAQVFSAASGVDLATEKIVAARETYEVRYIDNDIVKRQQGIADRFALLQLIPHSVDVRSIAYVPSAAARASLAKAARG
jgi:aliphatic sulfonates family ABC transporter substrate-binding protein